MTSASSSYPAYRDSGVQWLGEIPQHWQTVRAKNLFEERVEKGYPELPLLAATQTKGVVPKDLYESRTVVAQKDLHLLKFVEEGDFVISLRSFQGGIEFAHYRGIISPAYTVLTPRNRSHSGFLRYFLKSDQFISALKLFVTGIREGQNIDYDRLQRSSLPVPPADEQAAIVKYLAHVDRKIDRFICSKRRMIELLNEQKQAIIHQAVTKGLDPSAPKKDSGVE